MKTKFITLAMMVFAAAMTRLIPHPWNFTAIAAMALFGGAYFDSKLSSVLVPLGALFLSDMILGFHSTMPFVYGAFLITVVLGWTMSEKKTALNVVTYSLASSMLFFVISNYGVWAMDSMYSKSFSGLVECYLMALPFLKNQILGDLFFSGVMFGAFEFSKRRIHSLA